MSRRNLLILMVVIAITVFSIVALTVDIGGRKGLVLGLDLAGGTNLVYQADFTGVEEGRHLDALKGAKDIIERRINAYGVAEPVIQIVGGNRISIQLPGVTNIEEAKDLVGKTAELAFREQAESGKTSVKEPVQSGDTSVVVASTSGFALKDIIVIGSAASAEAVMVKAVYSGNNTIAVETEFEFDHAADESVENLWILAEGTIEGEEIPLTGAYLKPNCYVNINTQTSEPVVAFEWDDIGAKLFSQITGRLIGKPLGIFLDDILISAPMVQAQIGATGVIEGLNIAQAELLAIQLNAGALPVPLTCIEEQTIDATLGADSVRASLIAGIVGVLLVVAFMTAYYRFSGLLACIALAIYGAIMLMIFKMVPVTLTMAGIAAFILSLGMAVDANVLIFERMKEELRGGKPLGSAVEAGFSRAWPAIRDSNFSTLITCVILYWFGSRMFGGASVMGFALTLGIGVLVSMFTALMVSRTFLRISVLTPLASKVSIFRP